MWRLVNLTEPVLRRVDEGLSMRGSVLCDLLCVRRTVSCVSCVLCLVFSRILRNVSTGLVFRAPYSLCDC
jgi:hypothetical protein